MGFVSGVRTFVDEGSIACGLVDEVGIRRELKRNMIFLRTEIAGSWSATRSLDQPLVSGESRACTAGELCFNSPDKVYRAFARMDTDEEGDGSKKERRVGSGLYEKYTSWAEGLFCNAVPMTQRTCIFISDVDDSEVRSECNGSQSFNFSRLLALSICSINISRWSRALIRSSSFRFASTATDMSSFMSSASGLPRIKSIIAGSICLRSTGGRSDGALSRGVEFSIDHLRSDCIVSGAKN